MCLCFVCLNWGGLTLASFPHSCKPTTVKQMTKYAIQTLMWGHAIGLASLATSRGALCLRPPDTGIFTYCNDGHKTARGNSHFFHIFGCVIHGPACRSSMARFSHFFHIFSDCTGTVTFFSHFFHVFFRFFFTFFSHFA